MLMLLGTPNPYPYEYKYLCDILDFLVPSIEILILKSSY